ncbi:IS4 family transposase [bacterium]|nr:IS4 family transposase [bacterium]
MMPSPRRLGRRLRQIQAQPPHDLKALAGSLITLPPALRGRRDRVYPLRQVFWIFLAQVLAADKSCAHAVAAWMAALAPVARFMPSPGTAAYCRARARLALSDLRAVLRAMGGRLAQLEPARDMWHGRVVKVVDGSSVSMPDTPDTQRLWPQPRGQKRGCGFPVMRLVVLFSLSSGAALSWTVGSLRVAERTLWRRLWRRLAPGDIVLGDRGFCDMAGFWLLGRRGVDCVMRLHQRRSVGVRPLRRLGRQDWLVEWIKTKACPKWMTHAQWAALPATLVVRHVRFSVPVKGWRTQTITVATTLLDARAWPPRALSEMYLRRWRCELYLRDIKTTLGMEVLRCKSPDMIRKELVMFMIAHNLLRALIAQAAGRRGGDIWSISFKGAVDVLETFAARGLPAEPQQADLILARLLECIAARLLPWRPHRAELRVKKRRPKVYPMLTAPRDQYREIPHRNHYSAA